MSVDIEPSELSFQRMFAAFALLATEVLTAPTGPFTTEVARTLTLKNPNSTPVAFKVRFADTRLWIHDANFSGQNHGAQAVQTPLRPIPLRSLTSVDTVSDQMQAASSPGSPLTSQVCDSAHLEVT